MNKKENFTLKLIESRFKGLRIELRVLLIMSLISIFIAEFCLSETTSINNFQHGIGVIFIKLCYSYLSAFIFYYLVVYAPKERKKVRALRFVNNKIHVIKNLTNLMIFKVAELSENPTNNPDNLSLENIRDYCESIGFNQVLRHPETNEIIYNNLYEYIFEKSQKVKTYLDQLIILHELLDDDLFHRFSNMSDIIAMELTYDLNTIDNRENFRFLASGLFNLKTEKKKMWNQFNTKYYPKYYFQYKKQNQQ